MKDPEPPLADGEEPAPQSFREIFAEAIRKTGLGQVAPGAVPDTTSLLKAVGGVRGLIESIIPGLGFLLLFSLTGNVPLAVLAPVALAVIFVITRLVSRTPITQALAGVVGIAISAVLALVSGKAEANFIPGIVINIISVLVLLASIAARWPLIGVIVGFLTNEPTQWRQNRAKRRILYLATWLWVGLFTLRLAIEIPLFLANEVQWLGGTKLLLGVPLYAGVLWVTWLLVRAVYGRQASEPAG